MFRYIRRNDGETVEKPTQHNDRVIRLRVRIRFGAVVGRTSTKGRRRPLENFVAVSPKPDLSILRPKAR